MYSIIILFVLHVPEDHAFHDSFQVATLDAEPYTLVPVNEEGTDVIIEFTPKNSSEPVYVDTISVINCGEIG